MFYLKINDKIRKLIELLEIQIGCKYYCRMQLIAFDELEFIKREIRNRNLNVLSDSEYDEIKKDSEKYYFHSTHICKAENKADENKEEEDLEDRLLEEINKDKFVKKESNIEPSIDYEYRLKQKDEEKNRINVKKDENSISFAINMIGSFFLIVLGSYYLGKYIFEWKDANTYKLVLVVTIIVFIAEAVLLMIKLHRDTVKVNMNGQSRNNSFAFRFNKKYRNTLSKNKIHTKEKKE